jgi:hypothetical protein
MPAGIPDLRSDEEEVAGYGVTAAVTQACRHAS